MPLLDPRVVRGRAKLAASPCLRAGERGPLPRPDSRELRLATGANSGLSLQRKMRHRLSGMRFPCSLSCLDLEKTSVVTSLRPTRDNEVGQTPGIKYYPKFVGWRGLRLRPLSFATDSFGGFELSRRVIRARRYFFSAWLRMRYQRSSSSTAPRFCRRTTPMRGPGE
jgi:hypothetical protein